MTYWFRQWYVPDHMRESLERYVKEGCPTGDFLEAILSNNFTEACRRADEENLTNLPAYAAYIYNEMPMACHGSKEAIRAWLDQPWPWKEGA